MRNLWAVASGNAAGLDVQPSKLVFARAPLGADGGGPADALTLPFNPLPGDVSTWILSGGLGELLRRRADALRPFEGCLLHAVLPAALTWSHATLLPRGTDAETRQLLAQELAEVTELSAEEIAFDYWSEEGRDDGIVAVRAVAANRAVITEIVDRFREAGIQCERVDARPTCLAGHVSASVDGPVAAVDWGREEATFVVGSAGRLVYARRLRDCAWGGLVDALAAEWGIGAAECESVLRRLRSPVSAGMPNLAGEYARVARPFAQRLLDESKLTLDFARKSKVAAFPAPLLVLGSGAALPAMDRLIADLAATPVRVGGADGGGGEWGEFQMALAALDGGRRAA